MLDFKALPDSALTLFNEFGESYRAGAITTYTKTVNRLKMRWELDNPMTNVSPFTYAMVHTQKRVLNVTKIVPFAPGVNPKEIELEFAV
jgi:hypothetical protein